MLDVQILTDYAHDDFLECLCRWGFPFPPEAGAFLAEIHRILHRRLYQAWLEGRRTQLKEASETCSQ